MEFIITVDGEKIGEGKIIKEFDDIEKAEEYAIKNIENWIDIRPYFI